MPSYATLNLQNLLRKIGRGVVMYAVDGNGDPVRWNRNGPLTLRHLGDTQGEINLAPNETIAPTTLEEISGDAVYEAEYVGENPQLSIPLFLADPDLLPVVSPTGFASAGHIRTREVSERTVVVFPERLFRLPAGGYGTLTYTGGIWQLNGQALTTGHQTLLALSVWLWRCYFTRPPRRFLGGHGNDAKNIEVTTCQVMIHPDMPDGHHLYTSGDPAVAGINIETGSGS